jgi:hypothetical protein
MHVMLGVLIKPFHLKTNEKGAKWVCSIVIFGLQLQYQLQLLSC